MVGPRLTGAKETYITPHGGKGNTQHLNIWFIFDRK
jgi:hypothetical protein